MRARGGASRCRLAAADDAGCERFELNFGRRRQAREIREFVGDGMMIGKLLQSTSQSRRGAGRQAERFKEIVLFLNFFEMHEPVDSTQTHIAEGVPLDGICSILLRNDTVFLELFQRKSAFSGTVRTAGIRRR